MKKEIKKILLSNTNNINSFLNKNGYNQFMDCVEQLEVMFNNELWEIGADIMKRAGVKDIKTTYHKEKK